jgi:hypothetical protein
VDALRTEP